MKPGRAQASYFHGWPKKDDKEEQMLKQGFCTHLHSGATARTAGRLPHPRQTDSRSRYNPREVRFPVPIAATKSARQILESWAQDSSG